jgi:hypothetical protein
MNFSERNIIITVAVIALVVGLIVFAPRKTTNPNEVGPVAPTSTLPVAIKGDEAVPPETTISGKPSVTSGTLPASRSTTPAPIAQTGKMYKDFVRPTGFSNTNTLNLANTSEFTLKQFVGQKVILLNFWTTSASNALRVFPYLNDWNFKYKDKGLLVISIHAPRFLFEQSKSVVDATVFREQVVHPVVLDNNYETWNAYGNSVWPHQYLIDINGRIAYDHVGEGAYTATELKIQELLAQRSLKLGLSKETYAPPATPKGVTMIDLGQMKSPETYLGSARNGTLGNGVPLKEGNQDLVYPTVFVNSKPYLSGSWTFTKEYAMNLVANTGFRYQYTAKNVDAVLNAQKMTRVVVLRDGVPLTPENAGADIRFEKGVSYFYASGAHIYNIVNDKAGSGSHTIEFVIENSGLQIYTITFS